VQNRFQNTIMIASDHRIEAQTGCRIGHACDSETPGFPNSTRQAWTVALNGFHSAIGWSHPAICPDATNAIEMKVTGNSQISPPDVAASGVRTERPINAPIHENA
jgi:hypothetical protein